MKKCIILGLAIACALGTQAVELITSDGAWDASGLAPTSNNGAQTNSRKGGVFGSWGGATFNSNAERYWLRMQTTADNLHPKYTAGYTYSYYSTSVSSHKVKSKQIAHLTANDIKVTGSEISGDNCAELKIPEASNTISGFIEVAAGDAIVDKTIGLQLASESHQSRFRADGTSSVSALLTQHADFNGNGIIFETSFDKNNQGNLVSDDFVLDMTLTGGRHLSGYLELDYNNNTNSTNINKPRKAARHIVKLASVTDYFREHTVYKVRFEAIKSQNGDPTQNDLTFSLGGHKTNITIGTSQTTHTFEVDADAAKILGRSLSLTVAPEGEPASGCVNRFRLYNLQISAHTPPTTVTKKIVGAWDFNDKLKVNTSQWKSVSLDALASGSKINDITVTLTDKLNNNKAIGSKHNISAKATFVNDADAIKTFESNSIDDHAIYNDFLVVGDTNPVITITGLKRGQKYEIQWIGSFVVDNYKIQVKQNGVKVDSIQDVALSKNNTVVYSTPYEFTATEMDPYVEFAFKQEKGGYRMAYGISGLVIRSIPDVTAPTCKELNPVDDTTHVKVDDNLVMTFSEPIDVKAGGNIMINNLTDGTVTTISVTDGHQVSVDGTVLTINPADDLHYAKNYAVLIEATAVQDLNGNPFNGITDEHTWNFTTGVQDTSPPSVTAYSPARNSKVVMGADLALTFDEPIQLDQGRITIKNLSDTNAVDTVINVDDESQVYAYGEVLTINPSDDLVASNTYAILIDPGAIQDESGNDFQGISTGEWEFSAKQQDGPNIIVIFADDHGYTDLGVHDYDKYVRTPTMDTLAKEGALMTSGYSSAPQCTPSRAGLMSGRIQNEFGQHNNRAFVDYHEKNRSGYLPLRYPKGSDMAGQRLLTIADRMKALGYKTGISGKWHIGPNDDPNKQYDPRSRGFEEYWVGQLQAYWANFDLNGITKRHKAYNLPDGMNRVIGQGLAAEAFIERNYDKAFFLFVPFYGPHTPMIDEKDPYYLNFGTVDYKNYSEDDDKTRRKGLALIHAMDDAIKGIVDKLNHHNLLEDTVILYCSDNGAPLKQEWNTTDTDEAGTPREYYGNGWNGSENVPLRGVKGNLLEGGIRVPMFAYWKGQINPQSINQIEPVPLSIDEMVTSLDFTATCVALGGGPIPPEFDGVNIMPRLKEQESLITRTKPMFWDFRVVDFRGGEQAVRKGDWKLWRNKDGDRLFKISDDPMELFDLAEVEQVKAAELGAELDAWSEPLEKIKLLKNWPATARQLLAEEDKVWGMNVTGNTVSAHEDGRYLVPYNNRVPERYPVAILKINENSHTDSDQDGAHDALEYEWGRNPFNKIDGSVDADSDGQSDLFEMIAGYSPDNPLEFFTSSISVSTQDRKKVVLSYDAKKGRVYQIEGTDDLVNGSWKPLYKSAILPNDQTLEPHFDISSDSYFYRFKISYPLNP